MAASDSDLATDYKRYFSNTPNKLTEEMYNEYPKSRPEDTQDNEEGTSPEYNLARKIAKAFEDEREYRKRKEIADAYFLTQMM
jgi:hypothetical protein